MPGTALVRLTTKGKPRLSAESRREILRANLKKARAAKRAKRTQQQAPTARRRRRRPRQRTHEVDAALQNHVSYAFGHCETWLDLYAAGAAVPREALARGVARLLLLKDGG